MDLLYPDRFNGALKASAPSISPESGFGTGGALIFEILLAFFLVWVVFAVALDERRPAVGGVAIGLTVSVGVLVGGAITGAAMNPARAFGPQLVFAEWPDAWIYYLGPLVGGSLAALLFTFLYAPAPRSGGPAAAGPPDHGSDQAPA
jgi:glycerol uptake facilitator-like aquaporin